MSLSKPRSPSSGATSTDVVTRATVEEPWAVLRAAAIRNGTKMPMPSSESCSPR